MYRVNKINYIDGYKLSLTFNDKKTKVVDLEPYLDKGIFLILKDPNYFKKVKLSSGTLVWPNEADFCADVLYEIGKEIQRNKKAQVKYQATYAMTKKSPKKQL